ncbi:hypothetical protein GCM10011519_09610 [Marmoricola endophyticus]|uniref:LysM domain-containing protein n=1 Tax=Marmoricola endophyticus TaxID=2040280 RepID=A0A917F302_9ACTN|nr:lytic transglycosylase domain-containing protein [Marmoricola endophyticus]GGF38104.1 hypothetical protein GCM10011519_09610 [Marmoricola endophyticus]
MPLIRLLGTLTITVLIALGGTLLTASSAQAKAKPWPGHPDRHLVDYRVRPGDTAAGIATRFHAWTAELRRVNHKTTTSTWFVGERVTVPVVTSRAGGKRASTTSAQPKRTEVRRAVIRAADRHGVARSLALAVAWHESGWQQQVRSPVGAVGTMQVMPGNRSWLSTLVGRELHLKDLGDNATAGVVLLKILRSEHSRKGTLAAYYQGQGSIESNGVYKSTKQYVANVTANQMRLIKGWRPDR